MILGTGVAGVSSDLVGNLLVTSLERETSIIVDGGGHTKFMSVDGRLVLGRTTSGPNLDLAFSGRVAWPLLPR
jgi:hypothetical protein